MPALFFDCSSGISGDMTVAALLDLGVDRNVLDRELAKLGMAEEFHLHISQQSRQMITGTKFDVHVTADPKAHHHHPDDHQHDHHHDHHHDHDHAHHHHDGAHDHSHSHSHVHGRSYREIRELIASAGLSAFVTHRAIAVFHRIAVAEGRIHGCPVDDVGFHEVGAVDSIVDVVAACVCLDFLGQPAVYASHLFDGTGSIHCAHGTFPLPAPATTEILKGIPLRQLDEPMEFITPTGAALLAEFSLGFGPMPLLRMEKIGYGLGTRDTSPRPNVLRAMIGDLVLASRDPNPSSDDVVEIVTNLDDTTPELAATVFNDLLELGALDVNLSPIQMKKNRPGIQLTVLCEQADADVIGTWILTHTSAFGVRMHDCRRMKLNREIHAVSTEFGAIDVKFGFLGGRCVQASPEFESYARAAREAGVPIKDVYVSALQAAAESRKSRSPQAKQNIL